MKGPSGTRGWPAILLAPAALLALAAPLALREASPARSAPPSPEVETAVFAVG